MSRPQHDLQRSTGSQPVTSAAAAWAPLARFIALERAVGRWACGTRRRFAVYEFIRFGMKQAWACLFAAAMLAVLVATHFLYPRDALLPRYDAITLAAVAMQAGMLYWRFETPQEARIIAVFHVVGTAMEIFKTAAGSWIYPEPSYLRIAGVPLFTGFMYAAVGSYIARCWRLFDFRFTNHPPLWAMGLLSLAAYVNFFAHHYVWDGRVALFAVAAALFGPATIHYRIWLTHRRMPLLLGLVLVALFIWFAENIGTFASAWVYPHQRRVWSMVGLSKLGSWFLLMIISYTLAAWLNGTSNR